VILLLFAHVNPVARLAPVVEAENVPLRAAVGRVLAQDVVAGMNLPLHANSAVDGYALAHSDLFPDRETVLSLGGRAAAGDLLGRPVNPGEAIRIFTGAPMPDARIPSSCRRIASSSAAPMARKS
jgi:molybdopterin molybdotransferase